MTGFAVRPIQAADVSTVAAICRAAGAEIVELSQAGTGPDGLVCLVGESVVGALLFTRRDAALELTWLGIEPRFRDRGVTSALVSAVEETAADRGLDDVLVPVRLVPPERVESWEQRTYALMPRDGSGAVFAKALPAVVSAPDADAARHLGRRIAGLTRPGDVVLLTGELGAGKTTLAQGLGAGLGVRGPVTSPTFVISRIHPSLQDGPALVHVDAYRLGDAAELDDLDLDETTDAAVTVVEWGEGIADALSPSPLKVHLARSRGGVVGTVGAAGARTVTVTPIGARWVGTGLRSALTAVGRR